MQEICITTNRLSLTPRSLPELEAVCSAETDPEMRQAYREMIQTVQRDPAYAQWGTSWRIALLGGTVVGDLGFKGSPDETGTVELGYGIDPAHRRRGYAAEAVRAVVEWALAQDGVHCVCAQTEPDNAVSQRLLLHCGFVPAGQGEEGPMFKVFEDS